MRQRYLVVTHPRSNEQLAIVDGEIVGQQPVHHLVANYRWHRMDEDHIIMVAGCPMHTHSELDTHEKVSALPSLHSSKPIHSHFAKMIKHSSRDKHLQALTKHLDLDETHTMEDVVDKLVAKHGLQWAPPA